MPANNTAAYSLNYVRLNATADGVNTVVAAVAGKSVRVISYAFTASAAGSVTIQDTAGSPAVSASFALAANGGISYGGPTPAFETAKGTGLVVNNGAGVDATGHITYQLV